MVLWSFSADWAGSPPSSPSFPSTPFLLLPPLLFSSSSALLPLPSRFRGRRRVERKQFGNWHPGSLKLIPFSLIPDLEITVPIRHSQHLPGKVEYGVYESGPRKSVFPARTELRRGDWKTDSTSSTASKQVAPGAFTAGLQQAKHALWWAQKILTGAWFGPRRCKKWGTFSLWGLPLFQGTEDSLHKYPRKADCVIIITLSLL